MQNSLFASPARTPKFVGVFRLAWLLAVVWPSSTGKAESIIADHTVVGEATNIPPAALAAVKAMWVSVAGESHSLGYRLGCELLEAQDSRFQVNVVSSGTPEAATDQHLRLSRATWGDVGHTTGWRYGYGEEDWYTSATALTRTKASLQYCHSTGPRLAALGFGWCWDMTWQNGPGGTVDPLHQVRWAGSSEGGPEGSLRWGLDASDWTHTANSVCLDTYLAATEAYMEYCRTNGIATRVFFTTGPVDGGGNTGENGYQRHLKNERIRTRVRALPNAILFDYADILCWGDDGTLRTTSWTDYGSTLRTYPAIHADNMLDLNGTYTEDDDHIGQRGAVRLAKALWWMLARMDGWDPELAFVGTDLGAGGIVLQWRSRTNETYAVLCSTNLAAAAWEPVATGIPGTPPHNVHTVGTSRAACVFGIGRPQR